MGWEILSSFFLLLWLFSATFLAQSISSNGCVGFFVCFVFCFLFLFFRGGGCFFVTDDVQVGNLDLNIVF